MPKRTSNKHLPPNVHLKSGTYYYVSFIDNKRKWHKIGKTLSEAMKNWAELVEPTPNIVTMGNLFDRYMLEIAPKKAKDTYHTNKAEVINLYKVFGHMIPSAITPVHIYKYLDVRGKIAPVRANREKALLSHVFSTAIRWGIVSDNPCKHVKRITERKRDRYITDSEFNAIYNLASLPIKNIMMFGFLTGLRQLDILRLKIDDIHEEGIFVNISKTKNKIIITWSDLLKKVVNDAIEISRKFNSEYVFVNKFGKNYTSSGFQTVWQKLMVEAINQKIIDERFKFHDIRRKAATDMEAYSGREDARKLLGHQDQKTTGIYISGAQKVKPVK